MDDLAETKLLLQKIWASQQSHIAINTNASFYNHL